MTNIWLACQAYNDPLKDSVIHIAQAQKYAAGISDLLIAPNDKAASCAMKAAFEGKAMTETFHACYIQHDTKKNIWGFGGYGNDFLVHNLYNQAQFF